MAGYDRPENSFIFKEPNQKRNTYNITFLPAVTGGNVLFFSGIRIDPLFFFPVLPERCFTESTFPAAAQCQKGQWCTYLPPLRGGSSPSCVRTRALSEGQRGYRPSALPAEAVPKLRNGPPSVFASAKFHRRKKLPLRRKKLEKALT